MSQTPPAPRHEGQKGRRGQPLVVLALVLLGWLVLRLALWQSPLVLPSTLAERLEADEPTFAEDRIGAIAEPAADEAPPLLPRALPARPPAAGAPPLAPRVPAPLAPLTQAPPPLSANAPRAESRPPARRVIGHTMMLAAGLSALAPPPALAAFLEAGGPRRAQAAGGAARPVVGAPHDLARAPTPRRWAGDGWAFWRDESGAPLAATRPSYGRSQVGAVLRYRLDPASAVRPQAHLRASSALSGGREREAALGLSARLPTVPVRLAAEARLRESAGGREVRAAAYAVSEFPPLDLPHGATGEAYVQGGYVGGEFATGFIDAQARITREIGGRDDVRLAAGAGAWGGAQKGASRLDIGPSAQVRFRLGEGFGRLSADYRVRVAGEAAPASGPALTLSAGF